MRHSAAHVMAAAVRRLWPDALFDIGPDTAEGFYYDFDLKHRLTVEDFPAIEAEMAKIVAENAPFVREEKTRAEVLDMMTRRGQKYKLERLADIPEFQATRGALRLVSRTIRAVWARKGDLRDAYLLQPQAFIIGGGVSAAGPVLFDPLRRHLNARLSPHFSERLVIKRAELGNDAGVIGSATLTFLE